MSQVAGYYFARLAVLLALFAFCLACDEGIDRGSVITLSCESDVARTQHHQTMTAKK